MRLWPFGRLAEDNTENPPAQPSTVRLADAITTSLRQEACRWTTHERGKPYICIDYCSRDDGLEVMVDDSGGYVRIQGLGEYGAVFRVYGDAERRLKRAMHSLHLERNEDKAGAALQRLTPTPAAPGSRT